MDSFGEATKEANFAPVINLRVDTAAARKSAFLRNPAKQSHREKAVQSSVWTSVASNGLVGRACSSLWPCPSGGF